MSKSLAFAAERLIKQTVNYPQFCYDLANAYLAEHPADDEEPISEEWLHSVGFEDDRAGTPTAGALHIRHAPLPKMDSDEEYPAHACVRSFPIPVPKTRGDVRRLCRALGIALKETP